MEKFRRNSLLIASIPVVLILIALFILILRGQIIVPKAIEIGPLSLRFYSLFILAGILIASYFINKLSKKHTELKHIKIDEALFWVIIPGIILARAWYVIIFWDVYQSDPVSGFYIWEGGLSIFGGLFGGLIGAWAFARRNKFDLVKMIELTVIFVPIGQIFGRFGNFINQELFGPETDLPWGMYVRETDKFHHPAFLYEQIGNIILFYILFRVYRSKGLEGNGRLPALYLLGYGTVRFVVDIFRNDRRVAGPLTIAQIIVILFIVFALLYLMWLKLKESRVAHAKD
ncbi:MAG: prolipoprotein diacylglyceryl transferase [Candidatus Dojkabacteria bacterium]